MKIKTGPANWHTSDLTTDTGWIYEITDIQKQHLSETIKKNYDPGRPLFDYSAIEFDLSAVWPTLEKAFWEAHHGRGLALVRGLPRETLSEDQFLLMNWIIGLNAGVARPQGLASQYIAAVRDVGTNYRASNGRGYSSNAKLDFRVDGADITTLICFNKAKSGGQSMISSGVTANNFFLKENPDLADTAEQHFYFSRQNEQADDEAASAAAEHRQHQADAVAVALLQEGEEEDEGRHRDDPRRHAKHTLLPATTLRQAAHRTGSDDTGRCCTHPLQHLPPELIRRVQLDEAVGTEDAEVHKPEGDGDALHQRGRGEQRRHPPHALHQPAYRARPMAALRCLQAGTLALVGETLVEPARREHHRDESESAERREGHTEPERVGVEVDAQRAGQPAGGEWREEQAEVEGCIQHLWSRDGSKNRQKLE